MLCAALRRRLCALVALQVAPSGQSYRARLEADAARVEPFLHKSECSSLYRLEVRTNYHKVRTKHYEVRTNYHKVRTKHYTGAIRSSVSWLCLLAILIVARHPLMVFLVQIAMAEAHCLVNL